MAGRSVILLCYGVRRATNGRCDGGAMIFFWGRIGLLAGVVGGVVVAMF